MQQTSALYNSILTDVAHYFEVKLVIDGVGTFGETQLFSIHTNVEMFQQTPTIGKAVAGEIEITMLNPSATIPIMATLRPYVRACGNAAKSSKVTIEDEKLTSAHATYSSEVVTFDNNSGATVAGEVLSFAVDSSVYAESEWLPQGVYFIDTREVTQNNDGLEILTIHGYDAMLKSEQDYTGTAVGGDYDTAFVRAIASKMGVQVDDRTWTIMGTGRVIPFPLGYSMREILGYIAASYVGCFIISDVGKLRLVSLTELPAETNYLIDHTGDIITFGTDRAAQTVTASGAIATFTAGGEYPLTALEIAIEPLQSGSGDSSPDNVRPITGWTGANINNAPTVITFEQGGLYDASGGENNGTTTRIRSDFIPVSKLRKIANVLSLIRMNSADTADIRKRYFYWYDANRSYIHEANGTFNEAFPVELSRSIIPDGAEYLRLVLQNYKNSIAVSPNDYKVSINQSTVPITWQSTAGAIYKGTLNVVTGVLTATHAKKTYTGGTLESWNFNTWNSTYGIYRAYIAVSDIDTSVPETDVGGILCDTFKSSSYNHPNTQTNIVTMRNNIAQINFFQSVATTAQDWKTWLGQNNVTVIYPLSTPVTYQLTPVEVKTLLETNNLWSNTGNIINLEFTEPAAEVVRILV